MVDHIAIIRRLAPSLAPEDVDRLAGVVRSWAGYFGDEEGVKLVASAVVQAYVREGERPPEDLSPEGLRRYAHEILERPELPEGPFLLLCRLTTYERTGDSEAEAEAAEWDRMPAMGREIEL